MQEHRDDAHLAPASQPAGHITHSDLACEHAGTYSTRIMPLHLIFHPHNP